MNILIHAMDIQIFDIQTILSVLQIEIFLFSFFFLQW